MFLSSKPHGSRKGQESRAQGSPSDADVAADDVAASSDAAAQEEAPRDDSPLAAEPAPRQKGRARQRKPVQVEVVNQQQQHAGHDDELPVFEDDSPLQALAEAATAMCEVSREGPGTGTGWVGRMFDFGDGRGPQPVHYGRIGTFPRARGLLERVQSEAGGGYFKFATKGHPTAFETLSGPPIPLPSEQQQQFPNGAVPNGRGGFDRVGQEPLDPFESPDFDPETGIAPEEIAQSGLNGWYQNGRTGYWQYFYNGTPGRPPRGSRPPIPAAGFGMGMAQGSYDHSGDDRISRLEKLVEKIAEGPKEDPRLARLERLLEEKKGTDAFSSMMANQLTMATNQMQEAQKQRDHEFKMAQLKQAADEKERSARVAAEASSAVRLKELELEAIRAKAEADKAVAVENAKAVQSNASAAISSNERIAQIQADANAQVLKAVTASADKGNPIEIFSRGMQVMAEATGNKGNVEAISQAAERLIPSLVDGFVAVRTMNAGQSGSGQNGSAQGPPTGGESDDGMISRFVSLIATLHTKNTPPAEVPKLLGAACIVSGFDSAKLDPLIALGTPTTISAFLESAANKAVDESNKKKILQARDAFNTEQGKAWFASVRVAFQQARKVSAPQVPSAPPAGQIQGPGPSSPGK